MCLHCRCLLPPVTRVLQAANTALATLVQWGSQGTPLLPSARPHRPAKRGGTLGASVFCGDILRFAPRALTLNLLTAETPPFAQLGLGPVRHGASLPETTQVETLVGLPGTKTVQDSISSSLLLRATVLFCVGGPSCLISGPYLHNGRDWDPSLY